MTTYTTITDVETDPEAPLTSELAKKWRDNPIAMFEGAAGAPRLYRDALNSFAVGDTNFATWPDPVSTSSATYVTENSFNFVQAGVVRVTFTHKTNNSANSVDARVIRTRQGSDTILQTWSTTSETGTDRSLDVTVVHGDIISVQHRATTGQSTLSARRMRNDGTLVWDTIGGRSTA